MIIEFSADKPQNWLQHMAEQFGAELKDNTFYPPPQLGEGYLRHFYLSNGITLNYFRFRFFQKIILKRKAGKKIPFSPIMFYIHEKKCNQDIEGEIKEIFSHSPHGIFWPSSHIGSVWSFPVNEWVSNITIAINHQWLLSNCDSHRSSYIHQLLSSDKPFYIFEEITSEMHHIISEIVEIIEDQSHAYAAKLFLESKTTELLAVFIEKLIERPQNKNSANLNAVDIEKLFLVKTLLLKNISNTPTVKELAERAGFSESKLQKSFKQVFGKSIRQYALAEKMFIAQKMLKSRKYSVSETGYKLGYSNLSHFTKAFRNQFGINPKTFILQSLHHT